MTAKQVKKSDRNKSWRSDTRESGRRARKVQMTRHLIVCEGKETEPRYFEGMKRALGDANGRKVAIVVKGSGLHTLDLLEYAQDICRYDPGTYDHVWLAYDKDDFAASDFDATERRGTEISTASSSTYHALWSNPCFEVWLLLHFGYTTASMDASECFGRTDDCSARTTGKSYAKNLDDVYALLSPLREDAVLNAKKVRAYHEEAGSDRPSLQNPGTQVYLLVEELEAYLG